MATGTTASATSTPTTCRAPQSRLPAAPFANTAAGHPGHAVATGRWLWLLAMPLFGYGLAWGTSCSSGTGRPRSVTRYTASRETS
jgi:hypothetical protein